MIDFDAVAQELILASNQSIDERLSRFRRLCPEIVRQIELDHGRSGPSIFWGRCRNVDEFAGKVIVEPSVLELIFRIAKRSFSTKCPHAGLQHTYGYLLSIIDTPYGKKRDRWVNTSLEESLGLSTDLLGPTPLYGTLLTNATWLAGSIAFKGHPRLEWLRRCLHKRVAPTLRDLPIHQFPTVRVAETVEIQSVPDRRARVSLIADLLQLPDAQQGTDPWLLVYSISDDRNRHPEIVTLFTVSNEFVDAIRARASLRTVTDIRPRFNAWVSGFPVNPRPGTIQETATNG